MKRLAASLIASLACTLAPSAAHADAVPASCMTIDAASRTMGATRIVMKGYRAGLTGTGAVFDASQVTVADTRGQFTLPNLRDANALVSLVLVALVHGSTPADCHGVDGRPALHSLRTALGKGAVAEMTMNRARLSDGTSTYTADRMTVTMQAGSEPDTVVVHANTTGLSAPQGTALPGSLETSLVIPAALLDTPGTPHEKITISSFRGQWTKGSLDGNGWLLPGHKIADSAGDLHIAITDLSDILAAIQPVVPAGVTTALSVAQFMGRRDGNRVLWDLTLGNGVLKVNSIPIPVN